MDSPLKSCRRTWRGPGVLHVFAAALLVCSAGGIAAADDVIRLSTGETLRGQIVENTEQGLRFRHPVMGEWVFPPGTATVLSPEAAKAALAPPPPPPPAPPAPPPPPDSFWKGWKGSVDVGVNGAAGNTENLSARGAVGAKRTTDAMETSTGLSYIYSTDDGDKSKSRGEAFLRNDWLFKNSKWGVFAIGRVEYDEFQDWDWRLSAFAGPTYAFIKTDSTLLRGRAGAGVTKEIGGERNELIPEGMIGADFEHKFNDRHSVYASAEWLPSISDWPDYRLNAKAGYKMVVDPQSKMNLHVGIADRYDSNPGDSIKKNDLEYFLSLGWEF